MKNRNDSLAPEGCTRRLVMDRFWWVLAFWAMTVAMLLQFLRAQVWQSVAEKATGGGQAMLQERRQVLRSWTKEPILMFQFSPHAARSNDE